MAELLPTSGLSQRDQVLYQRCPLYAVPSAGPAALTPLAPDRHRLLAASDGIYIQARSTVFDVCVPITAPLRLPYGPVEPWIEYAGQGQWGQLPQALADAAYHACPSETAALVLAEQRRLTKRAVRIASAGPGHVTYRCLTDADEARVVLDMHSHGAASAYFSAQDDSGFDRRGIHFSIVFGGLQRGGSALQLASRICVHGYLISLMVAPWDVAGRCDRAWFQFPDGVAK